MPVTLRPLLRASAPAMVSVIALLAGTGMAAAQGTATPRSGAESLAPGVRVEVQPSTPATGTVDETALRYYARIRDMEKLEAEIRRLKALHPDWQTPTDLFSRTPDSPVDERPIWDLIGDGRFAEARARVAELRGRYPGWSPSQAMLDTLAMGEDRTRLVSASDAKQWRTVVEIADRHPALISCSSVDSMWRLAEARAELGDPDAAFGLYRTIVSTCDNAQERRATLQKAGTILPSDQVEQLVAIERGRVGTDPAALQQVVGGLRRGELAAAMSPEARKSGTRPQVTAETLDAVKADVEAGRDADGAMLVAWYLMEQGQAGEAEAWFRKAEGWGAKEAGLRGRIQALTRQGKTAEAARLARSSGLGRDYVDSMSAMLGRQTNAPRAMVVDFATWAEEKHDARAAMALGWWHSRREDPATAALWFENALAWGGGDEAVEGLALGLQGSGQTARFQALEQQYAGRSARLTKFFSGLRGSGGGGGGPATEAYARGDNAGCLLVLDGRLAPDPRGGAAGYAAQMPTDAARALAGRLPPVLPPDAVPTAYTGYGTGRAGVTWSAGEPVYRAGLPAAAGYAPTTGYTGGDVYGRSYGYTPDAVASRGATTAQTGVPAGVSTTAGRATTGGVVPGGLSAGGLSAGGRATSVAAPAATTLSGAAALPPVPVEAPGTAMQRAWCLLGLGRPAEAQYAFAQARAAGGEMGADAVYGEILTLMQMGLVSEAQRMIETQPITPERRTDLQAELLAARAQAAYDDEDYLLAMRLLDTRRQIAPERRDLALMRAWSLYHTRKLDQSRDLFQRLDTELSTPESREGLRVVTFYPE